LEKIDLVDKPSAKKTANIRFDAKNAISKNVLTMRGLVVGYAGRRSSAALTSKSKRRKDRICGRNATEKRRFLKRLQA
jgi:ATPase subunit of ABC transporter with duplicated ATPase domains